MPSFPNATRVFLQDLSANNSRDWFQDNRQRYESEWLSPAQELVNGLSGMVGGFDPPHKAEARINGSIRRLNRDVRFSRDKRPYDPRLHLIFWTGDHPNRSPALHLVLGPGGLGYGAGHWAMTKAELSRYRDAVTDRVAGGELASAVADCNTAGFGLSDETLKRLPRGYTPLADMDSYLKRKELVVWSGDNMVPPGELTDHVQLRDRLTRLSRVNKWLHDYVVAPE